MYARTGFLYFCIETGPLAYRLDYPTLASSLVPQPPIGSVDLAETYGNGNENGKLIKSRQNGALYGKGRHYNKYYKLNIIARRRIIIVMHYVATKDSGAAL